MYCKANPTGSPGRWYAAYALKLILVYILTYYDIELVNPDKKQHFTWTTATVPRSDVYVSFKQRTGHVEDSL